MTSRLLAAALLLALPAASQTKARARSLGIKLEGVAGANNAITDVPGVEVGHRTIISGEASGPGLQPSGPAVKPPKTLCFQGSSPKTGTVT